jgi:hypothetical protein
MTTLYTPFAAIASVSEVFDVVVPAACCVVDPVTAMPAVVPD